MLPASPPAPRPALWLPTSLADAAEAWERVQGFIRGGLGGGAFAALRGRFSGQSWRQFVSSFCRKI